MNARIPQPKPSKLRLAGIMVLIIGVIAAGIVYEIGRRAADTDLDPSMIGYDKQQNAQIERMYGKSGELMADFSNGLKQPGTQAGIILAISIVTSLICFRFAQPVSEEESEN